MSAKQSIAQSRGPSNIIAKLHYHAALLVVFKVTMGILNDCPSTQHSNSHLSN